jgi:hypothetical protein
MALSLISSLVYRQIGQHESASVNPALCLPAICGSEPSEVPLFSPFRSSFNISKINRESYYDASLRCPLFRVTNVLKQCADSLVIHSAYGVKPSLRAVAAALIDTVISLDWNKSTAEAFRAFQLKSLYIPKFNYNSFLCSHISSEVSQ